MILNKARIILGKQGERVAELFLKKKGYKLVEPGNFAYATIHLDEGSIGIAPERALISPMYTVFRVDESRVDPGYLEWLEHRREGAPFADEIDDTLVRTGYRSVPRRPLPRQEKSRRSWRRR